MPPIIGVSAPKCPRCGKSVYQAEQVIGPQGKAYHKPCLACLVCGKRLDSTLLVEHDGEPLCKNCHRNHLGQGGGAFNKAVPVRATLPTSPPRGSPSPPKALLDRQPTGEDDADEIARRVTGISIGVRARPGVASSGSPAPSPPAKPASHTLAPAPQTSYKDVRSIDDYVASSSVIPNIKPRSAALGEGIAGLREAVGQDPTTGETDATPATRGSVEAPRAPASAEEGAERISTPLRSSGAPPSPPPRPAESTPLSPPTPPRSQYSSSRVAAPVTPVRGAGGLPEPVRRTPVSSSASYTKTAPSPSSGSPAFRSPHSRSERETSSTPTRLAHAVASGTPLCARCSKAVYHAEQVIAASGGRTWHRPCLRCEGCGSTLQKGTLEEGPLSGSGVEKGGETFGDGCNTFCRTCYRKYFGPRGINNAGMSFPTA